MIANPGMSGSHGLSSIGSLMKAIRHQAAEHLDAADEIEYACLGSRSYDAADLGVRRMGRMLSTRFSG